MLPPVGTADPSPSIPRFFLPLAIVLLLFTTAFPTLSWLDFSNNIEVVSTATSLETRRDAHWLLPTLLGQPRTFKPPLSYWIAAAPLPAATVANLSDPNHDTRSAAYHGFATHVRWPFLLCSCCTLLATHALSRVLHPEQSGASRYAPLLIAATNLLFLRWNRTVSPDVPLALFVTLANVSLAHLALRGPSLRHALLAALTLSLATLAKGPVALLETIVPALAFVIWYRRSLPSFTNRQSAIGIPLFLLLALPWFLYVAAHVPHVGQTWLSQGLRVGTTDQDPDPPYAYLEFLRLFLPWTLFWALGLFAALRTILRGHREPWLLAAFLFLIPIALMTFAPQRKDRYLLPMIPSAALLAAEGLRLALNQSTDPSLRLAMPRRDGLSWLLPAHFTFTALLTILLPLAFCLSPGFLQSLPLPTKLAASWTAALQSSGLPWYPLHIALIAATTTAAILLAGILYSRRQPLAAILVSTFLATLLFNTVYLYGYRTSPGATTEMKDLADLVWSRYPAATLYMTEPPQTRAGRGLPATALALYTNRIVHPVDSPTEIPPSPTAKLLLVLQRLGSPPPDSPPGWQFADRVVQSKRQFYLYLSQ